MAYRRAVSLKAPSWLRWSWPPRVDIALAAAFLLIVIAEALFSPAVRSPVTFLIAAGISVVLLAWRRRFPVGVAAAMSATNLLINPDGELSTLLALVLVCFTVGSETEPPRSYLGLALIVLPFLGVNMSRGLVPSDVAAGLVFFVGPWLVGILVRGRTARAEEAVARADRLEAEQAAEAARAAADERQRIARELHDIVAHSISVVTIQTQAVRRRLRPDQTAEAADLAAVEATAREALTEMRRLFGVLRSDGEVASLAPQPGLAELDRLVDRLSAGPLLIRRETDGDPVELPPGLDLAAYRIVQEGLTNAIRHSGATTATVRLSYRPDRLDIVITDDGRGIEASPSGGHGLVGIRERVALYGGTADLTMAPSGGTRLAASLPLAGVAA